MNLRRRGEPEVSSLIQSAPREGCDGSSQHDLLRLRYFNPRTRENATDYDQMKPAANSFQSTHPAKSNPDFHLCINGGGGFQSAHPAGNRRLRLASDRASVFNPHPARGSKRQLSNMIYSDYVSYNPRAMEKRMQSDTETAAASFQCPREGKLTAFYRQQEAVISSAPRGKPIAGTDGRIFQSAPREKAKHKTLDALQQAQPRTPRGATRLRDCKIVRIFQSRTREGCDHSPAIFPHFRAFQSHLAKGS